MDRVFVIRCPNVAVAHIAGLALQHSRGVDRRQRRLTSNVAVEIDAAGNLKPSKSTERIDGMVTGIMALGRALLTSERHSVYETRGLLFV